MGNISENVIAEFGIDLGAFSGIRGRDSPDNRCCDLVLVNS